MAYYDRDKKKEAEIWAGNRHVNVQESELVRPFGMFPINKLPVNTTLSRVLLYLVLPVATIKLTQDSESPAFVAAVNAAFAMLFGIWMFRTAAAIAECAIKTTGAGHTARQLTPLAFAGYAALIGYATFDALQTGFNQKDALDAVAGMAILPWIFLRVVKFKTPVQWDPPESDRTTLSGEALTSLETAQQRVREQVGEDEELMPWGVGLPSFASTLHFLFLGAPGSGKTLLMKFLMNWVITKQMKVSDDVRMLVYDAKQDILGYVGPIAEKAGVPLVTLNPFDQRCHPWAIAVDINDPDLSYELGVLLIPKKEEDKNAFFDNGAREILVAILDYFIAFAPGDWTLRDVVLATRTHDTIRRILEKAPDGETALDYMRNEKTSFDVVSTLHTHIRPLETVARLWHQAENPPVSIQEWLAGPGILVLGHSERSRAALDAVNRIFFKRLSQLTLEGREVNAKTDARRTWFFLDEIREMGQLDGFVSLLTRGRSKGASVVLGFQDIAGLRDVYTPDKAEEIAGLCANKCFLRIEDPASAQWASSVFSKVEILERSHSYGESFGGQHSTSHNTSESIKEVQVVREEDLLTIPETSLKNGCLGYYKSPLAGKYALRWVGETFDKLAPTLDPHHPHVIPVSASVRLNKFTAEDKARLHLEFLPDGKPPSTTDPSPSDTGNDKGSSSKTEERRRLGGLSDVGR